ncbi:MAG: hypothetical protein A3F11_07815 [Gammaproteobacteria bacterium RIFCSPHIGHO2_12_FULL_37_14]|nr:MAG: hypothetical protein A3F11_07815 [Gammaproteobacteria bacterium RIFCSPHIGHO2_12_FULL_37_14]
MIRVLFLCHRYTDVQLGGLAEFLHFLPLALKTFGIDSIIYTAPEKKKSKQLINPHLLTNQVPHYVGPLLKPGFFVSKSATKVLIEICKKEKIDLIHAQGVYRAGYMAMHIDQQLDIPYVVTSHSDLLSSHSKRMRQFHIRRRCQKILNQARFITHLSPIMAEAAEKFCSVSSKSTLIHNGVDRNDWIKYADLPESNYLLAIGRLEPEKGFSVLIDAYANLVKQGMDISLIIAGTGSSEQSLQQQAKNYQLNVITEYRPSHLPNRSIIFTGYVKNETKKILFAQAKLVLFATQGKQWTEPFGIVQLEAMAAGKALIASDIPIVRYLQSLGLQALLVDGENKYDWAQTIANLLANKTLRSIMGKNNQEAAKKFSWDIIAKSYADIYKKIHSCLGRNDNVD